MNAKERYALRSRQRNNAFRKRVNAITLPSLHMYQNMKTLLPSFNFKSSAEDVCTGSAKWESEKIEFAYAMAAYVAEVKFLFPALAADLMPDYIQDILDNDVHEDDEKCPLVEHIAVEVIENIAEESVELIPDLYYHYRSNCTIHDSIIHDDVGFYINDSKSHGLINIVECGVLVCDQTHSSNFRSHFQAENVTFKMEDPTPRFPLPTELILIINQHLSCEDRLKFHAAFSNVPLESCSSAVCTELAYLKGPFIPTSRNHSLFLRCVCTTIFFQYYDILRPYAALLRYYYMCMKSDGYGSVQSVILQPSRPSSKA